MVILKIVEGDLINDNKTSIICQQCNCVTIISHGLSQQIALKYPWADVYKRRPIKTRNCTSEPSIPGTIQIDKNNDIMIIHMFTQVLPGRPYAYSNFYSHIKTNDGPNDRINYFKQCLQKLDELELKIPVAMPYKIGCGLAGGNWKIYQKMLEDIKTQIILYHYEAT